MVVNKIRLDMLLADAVWCCAQGKGMRKWSFQIGQFLSYLKESPLASPTIGSNVTNKQHDTKEMAGKRAGTTEI